LISPHFEIPVPEIGVFAPVTYRSFIYSLSGSKRLPAPDYRKAA